MAHPIELNVVDNMGKDMKRTREIRHTGGASLPEDIINDILTMLPAKSLLRFRCVSMPWCNLIESSNFVNLQLKYSLKNGTDGMLIDSTEKIWYLDYDSLMSESSTLYNKLAHVTDYPSEHVRKEIVGSCNGLVCYISLKEDIIILNPFTKDYKKIPTPPPPGRGYLCSGFGYDLETEDYKLVLYDCDNKQLHGWVRYPLFITYIHVYSLKLNSWKTVTSIPFEVPFRELVFFNGWFYGVTEDSGLKKLSCFDAANDIVKHILLPENCQHKFTAVQVCVLGNCLCVIASDIVKKIRQVLTMQDCSVGESWTELFTVEKGKLSELQHFDLKHSFKKDAILVHHYDTSTYFYDVNHEVARELKIDGILPGRRTWAFGGSLVLPN